MWHFIGSSLFAMTKMIIREKKGYLKIMTCEPSIYTMNHSKFILLEVLNLISKNETNTNVVNCYYNNDDVVLCC